VQDVIEPGSGVHTDGSRAYEGLEQFGYAHDRTVLLGREASCSKLGQECDPRRVNLSVKRGLRKGLRKKTPEGVLVLLP